MKSKDELETLIKDLSEKQQSYQFNSADTDSGYKDLGIPELIPVDFDLTKSLQQEQPVEVIEQVQVDTEKPGFFAQVITKFKSFYSSRGESEGLKAKLLELGQKIKNRPGIFIVATIALVVTVGFGIFSAGCSIFNADSKAVTKTLETLNKPEESNLLGSDRINILLLGIDSPDGKFNARSDSIILVSIDPKTQKVSALSIPRDAYVQIAGHGKNKINSANEVGGADLAVKTVSDLLAVQIDHYVVTNFNGFQKLVDALGGVDINVEKNMYYHTYYDNINLKKGLQHLDGKKALQYVRFRHDALGDISRTQRQQKFMMALAKEIMKPQTLLRLPKILPELSDSVKTDLSVSEMISFASTLKSFDLQHINTQTLPGNFINIKGISYWYVDADKAKQVVLDVFVGKTSDEIVDPNLKPGFADTPYKKVSRPIKTVTKTPKPTSSVNNGTYKDNTNNQNTTTVPDGTYQQNKQQNTTNQTTYPSGTDSTTVPEQTNQTPENQNQQNPTEQNPVQQNPVEQNPTEENPTQGNQNNTENTTTPQQETTTQHVY